MYNCIVHLILCQVVWKTALLFLLQLLGKDDITSLQPEDKEKIEELLVRHGLNTHVPLTTLNKDAAANNLMIAEVLVTRILPLETLIKGMNSLGLADLLRKYPFIERKVFPSLTDVVIDVDQLCNKIKFDEKKEMKD